MIVAIGQSASKGQHFSSPPRHCSRCCWLPGGPRSRHARRVAARARTRARHPRAAAAAVAAARARTRARHPRAAAAAAAVPARMKARPHRVAAAAAAAAAAVPARAPTRAAHPRVAVAAAVAPRAHIKAGPPRAAVAAPTRMAAALRRLRMVAPRRGRLELAAERGPLRPPRLPLLARPREPPPIPRHWSRSCLLPRIKIPAMQARADRGLLR
jgi:hypothetical protein